MRGAPAETLKASGKRSGHNVERSQLEYFVEQNWAACTALAYHNNLLDGRAGRQTPRTARPGGAPGITRNSRHAHHLRPARTIQTNHRSPSTEIHPKVSGYNPEKLIVDVSLDREENLRLIGAEQNPKSVECFVNGADTAQDSTPVPEGMLALPLRDAEGACPL